MNAVDNLFQKENSKEQLADRRKRLSEMLLKEKQEQEVKGMEVKAMVFLSNRS